MSLSKKNNSEQSNCNIKYSILDKLSCKIGKHLDPLRSRTQRCDTVSCYCGKEWYCSGWKLGNKHPKEQYCYIDETRWWEMY